MVHPKRRRIGFKAPRTITKRVAPLRLKVKLKPKFTIRRTSSNRRGRQNTKKTNRSNPPVKMPTTKRIQAKRKVSQIPIPSGSGKFTRAVNVGGNKMQDAVFTFSKGKITNTRFLGEPVRQSRRFIEKRIG